MKNIQDILQKKSAERNASGRELDEKTIARVFLEVAKGEIKNLEDADVREIRQKDKTLYIKTAHPVISSELLLRRANIIEKVNQIARREVIEKIYLKSGC